MIWKIFIHTRRVGLGDRAQQAILGQIAYTEDTYIDGCLVEQEWSGSYALPARRPFRSEGFKTRQGLRPFETWSPLTVDF